MPAEIYTEEEVAEYRRSDEELRAILPKLEKKSARTSRKRRRCFSTPISSFPRPIRSGLTRQLLDELEQAGAESTSSAYVWDEAERNVRVHFPRNLDELGKLKSRLDWIADAALAEGLYEFLPEIDRPVLAAAINGNCTHLLTGDYKHFGELVGRESEGGSGCQPVGGAINRRTYNRSLRPS